MKNVLIVALLLVGLLLLAACSMQRAILFPAPDVESPISLPGFVSRLEFEQGYGLLLQPSVQVSEPSPLIIYAHGNAEVAFWSIADFSYFRELGYYVLLLEYPGYGGAPGRPSEDTIQIAALDAFDRSTELPGVDPDRIVAYGRSIGGGPATLIARNRPVAALILESTFSSLGRLVSERHLPAFLLRDTFDNEGNIAGLNIPILIFHGIHDQIIPIHHSERLAQVASRVTFEKQSCGHNDCRRPWAQVARFLGAVLQRQ